jgi:hypothetical protein
MRLSTGTYRNQSLGPFNIGRDEAIRVVDEGIMPTVQPSDDPMNSAVSIMPGALQDIVNRECVQQTRFEGCVGRVQAQAQEVARDARDRASVTTLRGRGNEFAGAQGLATYSKFRTFQVSTSEAVK